MPATTLSLFILRAISLSAFAITLILIAFSFSLLESHNIHLSQYSATSLTLLTIAVVTPVALWFASPIVVDRLKTVSNKGSQHSEIKKQDLLPLFVIILAAGWISRGLIEVFLGLLTRLSLEVIPQAVLIVSTTDGNAFGTAGFTQVAFGALLLWFSPSLSRTLIKITANN